MSAQPIRWMMTGAGKPLVPMEFDIGTPAADEVVVEIAGCGVCHTDLGYYYDGVRTKHELPLTLGHEISGHVIEASAHITMEIFLSTTTLALKRVKVPGCPATRIVGDR